MKAALRHAVAGLGTAAVIVASRLLAEAGEPQAVWFWRDVLGVMR